MLKAVNCVLISLIKTDSKVYVAEDKSTRGKVLAVGENSPVQVGDTVIFRKYTGDEFEGNYFIKYEDILGYEAD